MKINIFGIGRSGTKALQLYLAYHFAKAEGKVNLNYEPYNFLTRQGGINYSGLYCHLNSKQILNSGGDLDFYHKKFLQNLCSNNNSTINKFVRANGRIGAINDIIKPNLNIVLIRDLYDILNSLARMKWDFISIGSFFFKKINRTIWSQFVQELKSNSKFNHINFDKIYKHDIVTQNAIYWYALNKTALEFENENTIFIDFADIQHIKSLLRTKIPIPLDEDFKQVKFLGSQIHSKEFPLVNSYSEDKLFKNRFKQKTNEYYCYATNLKKKPLFQIKYNTSISLSKKEYDQTTLLEETSKVNYILQENSFINELNNEIMESLQTRKLKF